MEGSTILYNYQVKKFQRSKYVEAFLRWIHKGERRCEICGMWVRDVEVPMHTTSRGGSYVHNFHVLTSTKGRKLIEDFARLKL